MAVTSTLLVDCGGDPSQTGIVVAGGDDGGKTDSVAREGGEVARDAGTGAPSAQAGPPEPTSTDSGASAAPPPWGMPGDGDASYADIAWPKTDIAPAVEQSSLFCAGVDTDAIASFSIDLWTDARGPFVLTQAGPETRLFARSGSAWTDATPGGLSRQTHLTGTPSGALLAYGSSACGVEHIGTDGTSACLALAAPVADVSVVDATLMYGVYQDRVMRYDGGSYWVQNPITLPAGTTSDPWWFRVWADQSRFVLLSTDGEVFLVPSVGATAEKQAPPDNYYISVWGLPDADIWLGSRTGDLVGYDGATWKKLGSLADPCSDGIRGIWSADNTLFVYTQHQLARFVDGSFEIIHEWSCDSTISRVWGSSSSDVYVLAVDKAGQDPTCGAVAVFWFDGTSLRQI